MSDSTIIRRLDPLWPGYRKNGYAAYRVLDKEQVQKKPNRNMLKSILGMDGNIVTELVQRTSIGNEDLTYSWHVVSEYNGAILQKSLFYQCDGEKYVLLDETNKKDGKDHGPHMAYDEDGTLTALEIFHENEKTHDLSADLKRLRFWDNAKAFMGIKRRDVDTRNADQLKMLQKRYSDLQL